MLHAVLTGTLPGTEVLLGKELLDLTTGPCEKLSAPALDLLECLLQPNQHERITAAAAVSHPWVAGRNQTRSSTNEMSNTLASLESFSQSVRLRRAALTAAATQFSGDQVEALRRQFLLVDTDGNGRISKEEFMGSFAAVASKRSMGSANLHTWIESIFDAVDTDGSREIEYTEWLAAAAQENAYSCDQVVRSAFRIFDTDGDGQIDSSELSKILAQTLEEVDGVLPQFDTNGDGVLDESEFRRILAGKKMS